MIVREEYGDCNTEDSVAPGDTAAGFTVVKRHPISGVSAGKMAQSALIVCEDNAVNFTVSGTTPTNAAGTNVGVKLDADQSMLITGVHNVQKFQCVDRVSGATGTVKAFLFF